MHALPESTQRVAAELQRLRHPHAPRMLDDAARTAQQAADGLGVALGQIAKSIIFRRKSDAAAGWYSDGGLRSKVRRLVRRGDALMRGGYRRLAQLPPLEKGRFDGDAKRP